MKFLLGVALGIIFCGLVSSSAQQYFKTPTTFKVWFLPLDAQPYSAVTSAEIEEWYELTSLLASESVNLQRLLSQKGNSASYSQDNCRLKVQFNDQTFLVDKFGVVKTIRGSYELLASEKVNLLRMLQQRVPRIGKFSKMEK